MNDEAKKTVLLEICTTCLGENKHKIGAEFYAEVAKQIGSRDINLQAVECLGVCNRPCTVAVSEPEKWTYIIGGFKVASDIPALFDYVAAYANSPNGRPPISERPEVVQKGVVARVPPRNY